MLAMVDWRGLEVSDPAPTAGTRLSARLFGVEVALTVAELALIGAPMALVCAVGPQGVRVASGHVLLAASVLAVALFGAWAIRLREFARRVAVVVSARASRQTVTPGAWQRAQAAYARIPSESGWFRFISWVAVATLLLGMATMRGHIPRAHAAGLFVVTLITLAGLCALRVSRTESVLGRVRTHVFPSVDAISAFIPVYRRRVLRVEPRGSSG